MGALAFAWAPGCALAERILVVASRDMPLAALTRRDAADLFLGRFQGEFRPVPLDQEDDALRERFYRSMAGLSPQGLRAYWAKQVFTGRGRPPVRLPADLVAQAVASDKSVVAYVREGRQPPGCKVLLSLETGDER